MQPESRNNSPDHAIVYFMKITSTCQKFLALALGFLLSGTLSAQIHLQENFNGNTLPAGWTVSDQGTNVCKWMIHAPYSTGGNPIQMLGSNFLFVNSDSAGNGTVANETITSPVINTAGSSFVYLQLRQYYRDRNGATRLDTGFVEVFNGTNWVVVQKHDGQSVGNGNDPALTRLDITPYINPALQVRFRYVSARAYYWAIDNVVVFTPASKDVGVLSVGGISGVCGLPANFPVTVQVVNFGSETQKNFPIAYQPNALTTVTETFTDSILAGDTAAFTFAAPFVAPATGSYTITSWTSLTGDLIAGNDSAQSAPLSRLNSNLAKVTFTGFTGTNLNTLSPGWGEATGLNPNPGNSAWVGATASQTTALGTETAKINLYQAAIKDWLISPAFNPVTNTVVRFKLALTNYNSPEIDSMGTDDSLVVKISTNCGQTWSSLIWYTKDDELTNQLTSQVVNLSAFAGQTVILGFYASEGSFNDENDYDLHLDDLEIFVPSPNDLGVTEITIPTSACGVSASLILAVKVYNNGTQIQTSIPVSYSVNGQTPVSETFTGSLAPGATSTYTFTNPVLFPTPGSYKISAWTALAGDVNTSNDSVKNVTVTRAGNNFAINTFSGYTGGNLGAIFPGWEEQNGQTPSGTTSGWVNSDPAQTTSLGSTTAKVNLYSDFKRMWMISPAFSPQAGALLKYKMAVTNYNSTGTDAMGTDDSVHVMVTTDCGQTWSKIKSYTAASALTNQLSDQSVSLSNYAGQKIRIAFFGTDGTVDDANDYDFHIDDIKVQVPSPTDLGVTEITIPTSGCGVSASLILKVKVFNDGTQTQTSIPVSYSVNGQTPVSETFTGSLAPGATSTYTFTNPVLFPTPGSYQISAWTALAGDVNTSNDSVKNVTVTRAGDNFAINTFTGYTGGNVGELFLGWEEQSGLVPIGTTSSWLNSDPAQTTSLGSTTAKVNLYSDFKREWMISPAFSPQAGALLKYKMAVTNYNSTGTDAMGTDDSVHVMVTTDCGQTWSKIKSYTAASALTNQLSDQSVSLLSYAGQKIRIAFFSTDGTVDDDNDYDFHLDDIQLGLPAGNDVGVIGFVLPNVDCGAPASFALKIKVGNLGLQTQSGFQVSFRVNSGSTISEVFSGTLASGQIAEHTFSVPIDLSASGLYSICAWTKLPADVNTTNDTLCTQFSTPTSTLPPIGFTNFNGTNLSTLFPGWAEKIGPIPSGSIANWQNNNATQFLLMATTTARINMFGNAKKDWITSPVFKPVTGSILKFKIAVTDHNTTTTDEMGSDDSVNVMITTDCGVSWARLKSFTVASAINNVLTEYTVALGAYAGQTAKIGFFATEGTVDNTNDYDFHIDDIGASIITGTEETVTKEKIVLYPNPANNRIKIRMVSTGTGLVSIYSGDGRCVFTNPLNEISETGIDVSTLPAGLYRVKIVNGTNTEVCPLLINR